MTRARPLRMITAGGVAMPVLGLGTWQLFDEACERIVAEALRIGYRHIDTAAMYRNEQAVGAGLRAGGVPREEIFLTTKVLPEHLAPADLRAAAEASLARLGVDHVDLLLVHWPNPAVRLADTMTALAAAKRDGLARAIGVANFPSALVEEAVRLCPEPLATNQVEYHPYLSQRAVLATCRRHGMSVTAYRPILKGSIGDDPVIAGIAARHGATAAQVSLAWLIAQDGVAAIPKTGTPARLVENLAAADLVLGADDIAAIDGLARPDGRYVDPAFAPAWDPA